MAHLDSSFLPSLDADLQRFFNEYFVGTDSYDDNVEFEGFTPDDICGLPAGLFHDMAELSDVDPQSNTTTKLVVGLLASCGILEKVYHYAYVDNCRHMAHFA